MIHSHSPIAILVLQGEHKAFPYYKHLLQKKTMFCTFLPLLKLVSKMLCHVFIVTFGVWMQHFQTGGLGETV